VSIIVFPFMLVAGFATHQDIPSLSMVTDPASWASEWRSCTRFHVGHLSVMFAVPFIIFAGFELSSLLRGRGAWSGFAGAVLGVFGAFLLVVDKGARTLVLTAFNDMCDQEIGAIPRC
jgi:hypothetical protein